MSSATTSKETRNRFKGVNFNINIDEVEKEIEKLPQKPSLKRNTDGTYHKLDDKKQYEVIQRISQPHIDSFDFMMEEALPQFLFNIKPVRMELKSGNRVEISIEDAWIKNPLLPQDHGSLESRLFPAECRMKHTSYTGALFVSFKIKINGVEADSFADPVGDGIPIMLKSLRCNLRGLSEKEMVRRKEDANEFGGYFVSNGLERVVRFLSVQRRNYPMGMQRKGWKDDGSLYSEFGVSIRCVRRDQVSSNMVLHYLNNGTANLKIFTRGLPITIPLVLVLKALLDVSDYYIFKAMTQGLEHDSFYTSSCTNMLQMMNGENIVTHQNAKKYIGFYMNEMFKHRNPWPLAAPWASDEEKCDLLLQDSVAPHLTSNEDKFNLLIYMLRKLFAVAKGKALLESPDNPMFHEVLLSGVLYFNLLFDRLQNFLYDLPQFIERMVEMKKKDTLTGRSVTPLLQVIKTAMKRQYSMITRPLMTLVSTGNLMVRANISTQQTVGLSVAAEKINYWRFSSNFRAIHRGSFFTEMKTTECRKLYPEAWGFICPVHTPDGSGCGLLNHLAEMCLISCHQPANVKSRGVYDLLIELGMKPMKELLPQVHDLPNMIYVVADGIVLGMILASDGESIANQLRIKKATGKVLDNSTEICHIPSTSLATQFPGLYLFSEPCRFLRPVKNLVTNTVELIGSFEQPYMEICVAEKEKHDKTTHKELRQSSILSLIAGQIPFPDFNQSPRNMYCCQMGKQTMGYPSHTLKYRSDTKMYQIMSPQSPLIRPTLHDLYRMDEFPLGTNAVVAVISYTGYDMEDALILNKSSVERGFFAGAIFKSEVVDLKQKAKDSGNSNRDGEVVFKFGRKKKVEGETDPVDDGLEGFLDQDGLPMIGATLNEGDPLFSYIEVATNSLHVNKYKSSETARVLEVKLLGYETGREAKFLQKISISLMVNRTPTIGDKFANRHGQKGVCSFVWPQESMPFTESGMVPDVLFNPHGYPSRMTIGMMIESMAGKAAAFHATAYDATPFTFDEDHPASDYYGKLLEDAGFNYYGTESMYSGVDGRQLKAKIFMGVLYYIRLRHMVSDKYQVRSTGPIDQMTHQPVHGRKRGGGIRFGEMERDSLLAHGTSFLLHDRLFDCSDKSTAIGCNGCGSIISTKIMATPEDVDVETDDLENYTCKACDRSDCIVKVSIPYVLRLLVSELASVNLKTVFKFK